MGGDMNITADDIKRISDYLECDPNDRTRIPVVRSPSDPDQFMLTITRPCFFLDLHTLECNIYDVRPEACRQYPWDLLAVRGCNLIDVFMCPSALKQLEDHIRSSRCPSDTFPEE
ncbi:MAG: YkgJ family cysteine cluster protein [Veillonellaceae bacterium]|nr:YkgJ family cysteine cluster protein [Veillonellaceae bacterium]